MLDIKKIRENKKDIEKSLLKRIDKKDLDLDKILKLDDQRKEYLLEVEQLQAERNKSSKTKPDAKTIKAMKALGEKINFLEASLFAVEDELQEALAALPNIVADEVVAGGKENNKIIKTFSDKPKLNFEAKNHVDLLI